MPKSKPRAKSGARERHNPLAAQIKTDAQRHMVTAKARKSSSSSSSDRRRGAAEDDGSDGSVPAHLSRKIMQLAKEQQDDIYGEAGADAQRTRTVPDARASEGSDDDSDDDDFGDGDMVRRQGDDVVADLNAADEAALAQFMPRQATQRRTLGDIIADKIREREQGAAGAGSQQHQQQQQQQQQSGGGASIVYSESVSDKVVAVYGRVGELLTRYRAGKVPKAFKIIPALRNWEEVLMLTNPEKWSSQSMFVATKIFASNLNPKNAQRFYNLILLPAVRDDISSNKRLNYHLYRSLKKACYKPAAFFKGILLPLCDTSEACTLREAVIIASVLAKVSIPMMHSAAALLKMATMPYSGVTSLFMKVLIDKKYAMPYRVIDAIVAHFMSFMGDRRTMHVLWHQCLLVFAQRYKRDISAEQKQSIKALLRAHQHHIITLEIRRELFNSVSRGESDGDVAMRD